MEPSENPARGLIRISVLYALAHRQVLTEIDVPEGTTVAAAVDRSGLSRRFPEIAKRPLACAIYGHAVAATAAVRAGDRIEILRPLLIDPKEGRRQAALRQRRTR